MEKYYARSPATAEANYAANVTTALPPKPHGAIGATNALINAAHELANRISHLADSLSGPAPTPSCGEAIKSPGGRLVELTEETEAAQRRLRDAHAALDRIDAVLG